MLAEVSKGMCRSDLFSLALVSPAFCMVAQQTLFRNVTLNATTPMIISRFVTSLESQPLLCRRLHHYIRSIHFDIPNHHLNLGWVWIRKLIPELCYMVNLKSLVWSTQKWASSTSSGPLVGAFVGALPPRCNEVLFYVSAF